MKQEDLNRNFGFLTLDVARLLQLEFDRRVKPLGVTRTQSRVLTSIYRSTGITQSELTEILDVQKAALGRMIDRLTEKGWLERRPDPKDRRVNRLHLTKEVAPLINTTRVIASEVRELAMNEIKANDRNLFVDTLTCMKKNLIKSALKREQVTKNSNLEKK